MSLRMYWAGTLQLAGDGSDKEIEVDLRDVPPLGTTIFPSERPDVLIGVQASILGSSVEVVATLSNWKVNFVFASAPPAIDLSTGNTVQVLLVFGYNG